LFYTIERNHCLLWARSEIWGRWIPEGNMEVAQWEAWDIQMEVLANLEMVSGPREVTYRAEEAVSEAKTAFMEMEAVAISFDYLLLI